MNYNFANLIGKSYQSSASGSDTGPIELNITSDVPLNDGMNGSIKAKSLYYVQLYAGVSYYFSYPSKYKKE